MIPDNPPPAGYEQYPSRLGITLKDNPTNPADDLLTDGGGLITGNILAVLADAGFPIAIGQTFLIGTQIYTIVSDVAGAQPMNSTGGAATFDFTTGDFVIQTNPVLAATPIKFFPELPVMGLPSWQTSTINNEPVIAFDTRYAYQFVGDGWDRIYSEANPGDAVWLGSNSQFFSAYTYQGVNLSENFLFNF